MLDKYNIYAAYTIIYHRYLSVFCLYFYSIYYKIIFGQWKVNLNLRAGFDRPRDVGMVLG